MFLHFNETKNLPRQINRLARINKFFDGSCTTCLKKRVGRNFIPQIGDFFFHIRRKYLCFYFLFFINEIYHELPPVIFLHADFLNLFPFCSSTSTTKTKKKEQRLQAMENVIKINGGKRWNITKKEC